MYISKERLENQAYGMSADGFDAQAWVAIKPTPTHTGDVPPGAVVKEDGSVEVAFIAPDADCVEVGNGTQRATLIRREDGVWTGRIAYNEPGLKPLLFWVNGNAMLNPIAPIGFGGDRAINHVDVPDENDDFLLMKNVPHGAVTREFFASSVTGQYGSCLVYTPPAYQQKPHEQYPVLYLQHGGGENENAWVYQGKVNFIMDNLLAQKKAEPMIIVMCNGSVQMPTEKGHREINADCFPDVLRKDCIPFIEGRYRALRDKWHRSYAGLSRGSLQGVRIVFPHLDLFGSCGLFTGFTHPSDEAAGISLPAQAEMINRELRVFYRAMGADETSLPTFERESAWCAEQGIRCISSTPPGSHEWRTWRRCAYEYLQLIFRKG